MDDYFMEGEFETAGEFGAAGSGLDGVVVGIPTTTIADGASADITVTPTQKFRAERLILATASRAAGIDVNQIAIASVNQNRGNGPVPAEVFTPDATHKLRGDIVDPATGIIVTVTNNSGLSVDFGGCFFGPAREV